MAKKCARTFSIVVEKGKKSILDVGHLLPDALPRSVRGQRSRRSPGCSWPIPFAFNAPWGAVVRIPFYKYRTRVHLDRTRQGNDCLLLVGL